MRRSLNWWTENGQVLSLEEVIGGLMMCSTSVKRHWIYGLFGCGNSFFFDVVRFLESRELISL